MRIPVLLVLIFVLAVVPELVTGAARAVLDAAVGVLDGLLDGDPVGTG